MKIALCLHGLFESEHDVTSNGYDGYTHIKNNILDAGNVDVFIHSWETEKESVIRDLYKPKLAVFETQKNFNDIVMSRGLDTLVGCPRSPHSVLSHLYSVTEAMKLVDYGDYDIVIKARFDLGRINRNTTGPGNNNSYPVQCINFQTNIVLGMIYMANWNHFHMGPADMWFYGSSTVMKHFTHLYDDLLANFHIGSRYHDFATAIEGNRGDLSNSIAFYKYWMIEAGLWNNKICLDTTWE